MKVKRKIIQIDDERCNGCGNCVLSCAEGAIQIIDGKARVVKDQYCDGLGACLGECPEGALTLVEREAEEFDEHAVESYLKAKEQAAEHGAAQPCGCPSTRLEVFPSAGTGCQEANRPATLESQVSALGHWPVQIRLVPPNAPFLKNADLLVTADCVPVAYPNFHRDFLKGKVVMLGCPKFDQADASVEKFAQIFKANTIRSVTALIMEVPCCSGLPGIVKKAMDQAGVSVPLKRVVIGARGDILG
jgi:Pyruvate/2-oxoacid:ferredoxin oxidoreductase delta subunit